MRNVSLGQVTFLRSVYIINTLLTFGNVSSAQGAAMTLQRVWMVQHLETIRDRVLQNNASSRFMPAAG